MRAVIGKEFRELLVVAFPMWIVGGIVAAAEIAGHWDKTEDLVATAIVGGLVLGLAQGLLDQLRRGDAFLKHRPLSADRLQLARTIAGLLVLAVALLAFFASLRISTAFEAMDYARLRERLGEAVMPFSPPMTYGVVHHLLVIALALGAWALARFVAGLRPVALVVPACLVVPVAAWALLARMPTLWTATWLAAAFALLFLGLVHVRETGRRGAVARGLLLALLLLIGLEGALWARSGLADLQRRAFPRFGLGADGRVHLWDRSSRGGEVELDADRRVVRRWPHGRAPGSPSENLIAQGSLFGEDDSLAYEQLDDPRFLPATPYARQQAETPWGPQLAADLTYLERQRRSSMVDWSDLPRWDFEEGRLVARRGFTSEGLAWVGPDGFHEGAPASASPHFPGGVRMLAFDPGHGAWLPRNGPWTLLDEQGGDSFLLRVADVEPTEAGAPLRLLVERRPFAPYDGPLSGPPYVIGDGRRFWLLDAEHGLLAPRLLADDEVEPRSPHWRRRAPEPGSFETWLVPQHPTRYGVRLRHFAQDGTERVGDVRLEPVSTAEKLPEVAMGLLASLRPPALDVAAFLSDGPATRSAMNRWWLRDPFFASRTHVGWLLVSLLVGALCALLAWRSARLRLPTRAAQWRWVAAVFLLGPVGLLWMKLAIGRTAVLPVGSGRRAVDLEATPDNAAPWPEPARVGTEVFAG